VIIFFIIIFVTTKLKVVQSAQSY